MQDEQIIRGTIFQYSVSPPDLLSHPQPPGKVSRIVGFYMQFMCELQQGLVQL